MRLERRERLREQLIERRQRRANDSASAPALQGGSADSVRRWRARERLRADSPAVVEERNLSGGERLRNALVQRQAPAVSRVPRAGTQPPERTGARALHNGLQQWSTTWRSDRRYDWRNHRNRYGSLFNFGFYHDPFGWGYRPFAIGWRMWPSYYSRSYWLNDPWQYRLPYAPPGYRWIRYYDDAILVDTWDGRVVDVIHHFFW
jgi:Ni/Co efflux regulator RcnB